MVSVPRLPKFVNPVKDAARAVKEGVGQMMDKLKEVTLSEMLDLPGFVVRGYTIEQRGAEEILHLSCDQRDEVAVCPRCREVSTTRHDGQARCIRDLDIWGKRTFVHFTRRRFECEPCGRAFTERLSSVDSRRRQTRRFEQYIYQRCLSSDHTAVAKAEWLHRATVKGIFKRWAKHTARRQGQPRVRTLGIDEIALKKRHKQYALVLSDLDRRWVICVLPDRSKERLCAWFDGLTDAERRAISAVSIDMWAPYKQAVAAKLPQANLVVDRFHVMKQLNDRLTQMRRAIQRQADDATKEALKGSRWVLVKNQHDLSPDEKDRLQRVLAASPELQTAYLLKEEFRTIFNHIHDRQRAERFLRAWSVKALQTGDPRLRKFVNTLHNWWDEILNFFLERVTNGFVEGINRAIRTIINRAYGYRNFDNFRLQVLARHGPPVLFSH